MQYHFWALIGANFIRVQSMAIGILSFFLGGFFWYFSDNKSIWVLLFIILFVIFVISTSVLVSSVIQLINSQIHLPKILNVIRQPNEPICLLEPSELFSIGIGVSFYYTNEHSYEQLICVGTVSNIQQNKLIQIKINYYQQHHRELIERLENNDRLLLDNIKVKPSVPTDIEISS